MTLYHWSQTAANNATADLTCPFPEGMAASALNDGTRGMMAAVAKYRDDIAGAIVTTGTNAAYLVTSYQGFDSLADLNGKVIAFSPHTTSTDSPTLSVDSLGAFPLRSGPVATGGVGSALVAGTLIQGTPYTALFNNATGEFYVQGLAASNPYNLPFLGGMDFWDTIAPNSRFIFPIGQAISRTVYSAAFARWGTTFGAGDGSTTFNVPNKTGMVSAMMEPAQFRLTPGYFGGDSTKLGATGGNQAHMLALAELPAGITSANQAAIALAVASTDSNNVYAPALADVNPGSSAGYGFAQSGRTVNSTGNIAIGAAAVTSNNTGGQYHNITQPTIICNYIIRIL